MANDIDTQDIDDQIVHRWLGGALPRTVVREMRLPPSRVQEALGRFIEQVIPRNRQMATARQLGRLDELISDYWPLAKSGNHKALSAVIKMIAHQCAMLGIYQPHLANSNTIAVQVNNSIERPPNAVDKLEKALERLISHQRREQEAQVVEAVAEPTEAPPAEHTEH